MLSKFRPHSNLCMLEVSDPKDDVDTVDTLVAVDFFVINCFFNGGVVKASFESSKEFVLDERKLNLEDLGYCLVSRPGRSFVVKSLRAFFGDDLPLVASVIFLV